MENKLLSVIMQDRASYNNIQDTLDIQDLSDIGRIVLEEVNDYYSTDEDANNVDSDIILSRLSRKYPDQSNTFSLIIDELAHPVSVPNVLTEYVDVRMHALGKRLANALSAGESSSTIRELMAEYEFLSEKGEEAFLAEGDDRIYIGIDDSLYDAVNPEHLIHVFPTSLNDKLEGGVPKGSHIVVFARPETGKSLFMLNMTAGFIKQDLRVLYIGNEDPSKIMRNRVVSNLTRRDKSEINANPDAIFDEAMELGFGNLIFADLAPGSVADVRRYVHKFKPDVFIVDQIRNLTSSKNLTKVESLEYIAQAIRNLAKEVDAVGVSVTQAGDSAENKLILDMGDVDFSNTGIPSTADLMIGIGINYEYEQSNRRMISFPKNKISGIHEAFPVAVEPRLSIVEDL